MLYVSMHFSCLSTFVFKLLVYILIEIKNKYFISLLSRSAAESLLNFHLNGSGERLSDSSIFVCLHSQLNVGPSHVSSFHVVFGRFGECCVYIEHGPTFQNCITIYLKNYWRKSFNRHHLIRLTIFMSDVTARVSKGMYSSLHARVLNKDQCTHNYTIARLSLQHAMIDFSRNKQNINKYKTLVFLKCYVFLCFILIFAQVIYRVNKFSLFKINSLQ